MASRAGRLASRLAYLVGLTYVARQETLTEYRHAWPLALLAAPFVYAIPALTRPLGAALSLGFLAWVGSAVSLLLRRQRADIPRAGVAGFALTLALQRFVRGT